MTIVEPHLNFLSKRDVLLIQKNILKVVRKFLFNGIVKGGKFRPPRSCLHLVTTLGYIFRNGGGKIWGKILFLEK